MIRRSSPPAAAPRAPAGCFVLPRAGAAIAFAIALGLATPSFDAAAADIPSIEGHVTDPQHKLKFSEKESLEDMLGKIQSDTQVDVAAWITDVRSDSMSDLGHEVYERWHIGRDWENGVLFVFPTYGSVLVIMNPDRPELTEAQVAKLVAADSAPSPTMAKRVEHEADEIGAMLRVGAKAPKARPPGTTDRRLGWRYAIIAALVAVGAVAASVARAAARRRRASAEA